MAQREADMTWSQWDDDRGGGQNMMAGAILASAVAAGMIAFLLRRARREEPETPAEMAARAMSRSGLLGDERLEAGRDFLMSRVVPEMKPALLAILEELEEVVDTAFRRAEKAIKGL